MFWKTTTTLLFLTSTTIAADQKPLIVPHVTGSPNVEIPPSNIKSQQPIIVPQITGSPDIVIPTPKPMDKKTSIPLPSTQKPSDDIKTSEPMPTNKPTEKPTTAPVTEAPKTNAPATDDPKISPATEAPKDKSTDAPKTEAPNSTETPKEKVTETPKEKVTEAPKEKVTEAPKDKSTAVPTTNATDVPTTNSTSVPTTTPSTKCDELVANIKQQLTCEVDMKTLRKFIQALHGKKSPQPLCGLTKKDIVAVQKMLMENNCIELEDSSDSSDEPKEDIKKWREYIQMIKLVSHYLPHNSSLNHTQDLIRRIHHRQAVNITITEQTTIVIQNIIQSCNCSCQINNTKPIEKILKEMPDIAPTHGPRISPQEPTDIPAATMDPSVSTNGTIMPADLSTVLPIMNSVPATTLPTSMPESKISPQEPSMGLIPNGKLPNAPEIPAEIAALLPNQAPPATKDPMVIASPQDPSATQEPIVIPSIPQLPVHQAPVATPEPMVNQPSLISPNDLPPNDPLRQFAAHLRSFVQPSQCPKGFRNIQGECIPLCYVP